MINKINLRDTEETVVASWYPDTQVLAIGTLKGSHNILDYDTQHNGDVIPTLQINLVSACVTIQVGTVETTYHNVLRVVFNRDTVTVHTTTNAYSVTRTNITYMGITD